MTKRHPVDTVSRHCVHTYTETDTETRNVNGDENRNENRNENRYGIGDTQGERGFDAPSGLESPCQVGRQPGGGEVQPSRSQNLANPAAVSPCSKTASPVPRTDTPRQPEQLAVEKLGGETDAEWRARVAMSPAVMLSTLHSSFAAPAVGGTLDATLAAAILVERIEAVNVGDLRHVEGMLFGQAQALQTVAQEFMRRAAMRLDAGPLQAVETYTRLALRAQAQSRATLETLAEMKNPRPVFINGKQVNVANGNQQVNNTEGPQQVNNVPTPSREGENTVSPEALLANKLLEDK